MAKMFYGLEEVQGKLGCTEEAVKKMVQDGKLREFRDGAKLMYKVDEVDTLAGGAGGDAGGSDISLALDESGEIGLALGAGGGVDLSAGSDIMLPDEDGLDSLALDESGEIGLVGGSSMGPLGLSEESGALDLSASQTGDSLNLSSQSADQISLEGSSLMPSKDDTVITNHDGVDILGDSDDDLEIIDPLAQTQMAPDLDDHVQLDSGSSGSGLLDLTREADDTSLGAELLEEIYPGNEEGDIETQMPTQLEAAAAATVDATMEMEMPEPGAGPEYLHTAVAVYDPASVPYGIAMIVPLLALVFTSCVVGSAASGLNPSLVAAAGEYILYIVGGALVLFLAIWGIGAAVSGGGGGTKTQKEKKAKAPKPKKEKKAKAPKPKKEKKAKK